MSQIGARPQSARCTLVQPGPVGAAPAEGATYGFSAWFRRCCDSATVWPDPCVAGDRSVTTMTTSVASNGASKTADPAGLSALLQIGPEAKSRIRILVVDDEHTLRESCASVLGAEGYDVSVCGRGQEALDLIKRRPFDIVLADLYMSQVDGLGLLRATLATNPDTIVIVMTGNPSVESSVEALRQGAWDYLPKPFSAQHLQITMGRATHTVLVGQETRDRQAQDVEGEEAPPIAGR